MRTIVGYLDGHPIWSENVPAENPQWGAHLGGRSISDAAPFMAKVVRPQAARYATTQGGRDYQESAAKGWATRRAK